MPEAKNSRVAALEHELKAASPVLVDNGDLLRGILAGCGDCIKILDLEGRLQFMSEGGKRVMEVEDFSKLKGCPWPDFWEGQGNKDAKAAMQTAIAGGMGRFQGPANTAKGTPRFWDVQVSPIVGEDGTPTHLLSISRDITDERKASERQDFLTRELQHRVKNTLANVISIANQTFKDEAHRKARIAFSSRLITLDRAHDALTESNWGNTSVRHITETVLQPHGIDEGAVRLQGPEIFLGTRQALALALAINELATNALKYGALRGGRVDVVWSKDDKIVEWTWQESGGPPVTPPEHLGFGSRVIKELLADELNGTAEITYAPSGLVCRLQVPAENLLTSN
jgi:two-component sensor histidine kinase